MKNQARVLLLAAAGPIVVQGAMPVEAERFAQRLENPREEQVAAEFKVPFVGIRVLSSNITNQGKYDPQTGLACQDYVYQVVKACVANLKKC
ncbi:hypothetical protein M6G53_05915 [Serratia nevei]|nr:hypothetical protein [Serratia nevei]MCP1104935.1 hypothetical protein [Serratia nevei]